MSITSELRLRRRGQLDELTKNRKDQEGIANDALTLILMKADPLADLTDLVTPTIRRAAETLDDAVRVIKGIDEQIKAINEELYG